MAEDQFGELTGNLSSPFGETLDLINKTGHGKWLFGGLGYGADFYIRATDDSGFTVRDGSAVTAAAVGGYVGGALGAFAGSFAGGIGAPVGAIIGTALGGFTFGWAVDNSGIVRNAILDGLNSAGVTFPEDVAWTARHAYGLPGGLIAVDTHIILGGTYGAGGTFYLQTQTRTFLPDGSSTVRFANTEITGDPDVFMQRLQELETPEEFVHRIVSEQPRCFPSGTAILLSSGAFISIENLDRNDEVFAFDPRAHDGRGGLVAKRVVRLFDNITDTWVILSNGLTVTPGHHFLDAFGNFRTVADILSTDGQIVLADGAVTKVTGEYIHYSEATANRFEQAEGYFAATVGGLALQPVYKKGWKTYNFEVEDLHTYVAGGVRVHNASVVTASGLHTYPGTMYQTGSGPIVVNDNGSYTHADGRVTGVGTRRYNADTNSWETIKPGPRQRETSLGTGPLVTLASGTHINAGSTTINYTTGTLSVVNGNGSVTILNPLTGAANTYGVGTRRYDADTNTWVTVQAPVSPNPTTITPAPSAPSTPPVGTVLGVAPNGGIVTQGHSGLLNSITQNSEAWLKATGQSPAGSWNNGVYTSPSGGRYYDRHLPGGPRPGTSGSGSGGGGSSSESIASQGGDGGGSVDLRQMGLHSAWVVQSAPGAAAPAKSNNTSWAKKTPVLLDLWGGGSIDPLFASSQFVDLDGDGYLNRMAWAGLGTGVLVIDTNNDGKINRSNEFVFTEWDSSATGDLEAVRNVFDSNHNGKLDAGDARWSEFKVLVDGAMRTLASLNIVSIDLTPKGSGLQYADGSSLNGTTVFTRSDGSTGMVGDATLVAEAESYRIERTSTTASDGMVTETILGYDRDGKLAFSNVIKTRADGHWQMTSFDDDGNGTIDRSQRYEFVRAADGSRTRTVSNIAAEGILTSSTVTWTSPYGNWMINTLDEDGDGNVDQSTDLLIGADGSTVSLTKAFSDNNTLAKQSRVSVSANGLTKTTETDANGDGVFEIVDQETTTVHADGSRTKLESRRGANGALLGQTETLTSADSRSKTVKLDRSGSGVYDETTQTTIAVDGTGKVSTTVSRTNADTSLRGRTVTTVSADGLIREEAQDLTGDGVIDRVTIQKTTINADGSQVQTTTLKSASGSLLAETTTATSSDRKTVTTTEDSNGDGAIDSSTTIVTGTDGVTTKTISQLAPNGGLIGRTMSQTSADGLATTSQLDVNGDGVTDRTELAVTVTNADGSQTRTVTTRAGNGAMLGAISTLTSANSLNQTITTDANGDGVADQIENRTLLLNADGSRTETAVIKAGNGTVLNRIVTTTSADRQTVTRTVDDNGDGVVDLSEMQVRHADGSQTLTATRTNSAGVVLSRTSTTISSDGFTRTVEQDINGDGVVDSKNVSTTTLNADGSRTTTTISSNGTGVTGKMITTTSGNGLSVVTKTDADGDGDIDAVVSETTVLNADGSRTTTALTSLGTTAASRTVTTVNATGLIKTVAIDADNNGGTERVVTTSKTLNADGSIMESRETRNANGVLLAKTVATASSDRKTITTTEDSNGDGAIDSSTTIVVGADGATTTTISQFKPNGGLIARSVQRVAADGLSATRQFDLDGNGVLDRTETETTLLNADGSRTTTVDTQTGSGVLIGSTTTTTAANGLSQTVIRDTNGDGAIDSRSVSTLVRNADGSKTETVEQQAGNGATLGRTVITTSGDGRTVTHTIDDNGDGAVDLTEIQTRHADGRESLVATRTNAAGTLLGKTTTMISSDGLTKTIEQDANGDGVVDAKSVEATVLHSDGSRTVTTTNSHGSAVTSTTATTISANGLVKTTSTDVDGNDTIDTVSSETTVLNADGSRTTTTLTTNGGTLVSKSVATISATGLTTSSAIDSDGNGSTDRLVTTIRQLNADGSTTDTMEARTGDGALLAKTIAITSGDGRTTTTTEDNNGDGVVDLRVETSISADGTQTVVRRQFGAAGALLSQSTTQTSANGLIQTIKQDGEGDGVFETVTRDATVINADGSQTRTISQSKADGTLLSRQIIATTANGLSRTTTWAGAAGAALGSETAVKVLNADGSTLETVSRFKADGTTLERKVTTLTSGNGRSVITRIDLNGDGKFDQQIEILRQADGRVIETRTDYASDGVTPRARTTITTSANGLTRTTQYDANADGVFENRTVQSIGLNANGSKTEITENFGPGAVLLNRIVTQTSANGLIESWKATGAAASLDTRREVTVLNADGSTTHTVTTGNESASETSSQEISTRTTSANGLSVTTRWAAAGQEQTDVTTLNSNGSKTRTITNSAIGGAQISRTTTATTADGMTITTLEERTGQANRTLTSARVDRADGFVVETLTTHNAAGVLVEKTVISTSPDQRLVSISRDADGNGQIDQREERSIALDGSTVTTITSYKAGGSIDNVTTAITSADGLTTTTERDRNGDGIVEHKRVSVTTQSASGERITVITDRDETGKLLEKTTITISADGMTRTTVKDVNGEGSSTDQTETVKADGGRYVTTVQENNSEAQAAGNLAAGVVHWKKAIARKIVTSTAIDGTETIVSSDYTGDNGLEHVVRAVTQIDGSIVSTMTEKNAAGAIVATGIMRQSADGRTTTLELDSDNNGAIDRSETAVTRIDGSVVLTAVDRNTDGSLKQTTTETISASGRLLSSLTSDSLGRKAAETITAVDGSTTTTTYNAAGGQTLSVVLANSKGVITGATLYDPLNASNWSRVVQSFDAAGKKTSEIQYMDDGTRAEITFDVASGKETWVRFFSTANVLTGTIEHDFGNSQPWSRIETSYDTAGRVTVRSGVYDDNTRSEDHYDPSNSNSWSYVGRTFNASGQKIAEAVNYDNGTRSWADLDPANIHAGWRSGYREYDAANRMTVQDIVDDNGTRVVNYFDPANANSWRQIDRVFNASGQPVTETQYMDDGSRNDVAFDAASGKVSLVHYYNASGVLTGRTQYDFSNVTSWSTLYQAYDGVGRVTAKDIVYDDGARVILRFHENGKKIQHFEYNSSGQLIGEFNFGFNGLATYGYNYDPANIYPWTQIYWTQDPDYTSEGKYYKYTYWDDGSTREFTRRQGPGYSTYLPAFNRAQTPVLLDLNGDGQIGLRPLDEDASLPEVFFDWDGDGGKNGSAWVGPSDGLLVIDLASDGGAGADGVIDQAKELAFSTWVDSALETDDAITDLEGLRLIFDTNHDNVFDSSDARWNEFRVWQDANQNGISDAGELRTLSEAGIKLINLVPTSGGSQFFADGSAITGTSSYQKADGTSLMVADASLAYRAQNTGL